MATMIGPFDYRVQVQQPLEGVLGGFRLGAGLAESQERVAAAEAQRKTQEALLARQNQIQTALTELYQKPNPAAQDFVRVANILPEKEAASLRAGFELLDKKEQENRILFTGQVMSALQSSQPQIGIGLLRQRAEAERNAGRVDQAQAMETYAKLAEIDPKSVYMFSGTMLATLGKPGQDALTSINAAAEEARKRELAPLDLAIKTAQAGKEGFDATRAGYEAGIKFLELQYKPQDLEDAIKKRAADLKLTGAQTEQAVAAARQATATAGKMTAEAEAARAAAAAAGTGIVPPEKRPEAEAKLRKEYNDNTKGFTEVRSAYDRVQASQDNAVGDLSLIFGYMKMLDPGSVVREGEFATAQNAAGVPDRVVNLYNRILRGERLNPEQRGAFKTQAGQLYNAAQKQEQVVRNGITRIGTAMGLKTENIFYEAAVPAGPPAAGVPIPTGAPAAPGAGVVVTLPNGQTATFPNQQAADAFKRAAGIR